MILLIDNYDSFTFNLVHLLGELGVASDVRRNDAVDVAGALASQPEAIVISPGPGTPDSAGVTLDLIAAAAEAGVPVLGVCLGHQAIGQAFGGRVVRAPVPMHGKISQVSHRGDPMFDGVPNPFDAVRYHSLVVDTDGWPDALLPTAWTADGTVMALRHRTKPVFGVQFHPESIASGHGARIVANALGGVQLRQDRAA